MGDQAPHLKRRADPESAHGRKSHRGMPIPSSSSGIDRGQVRQAEQESGDEEANISKDQNSGTKRQRTETANTPMTNQRGHG